MESDFAKELNGRPVLVIGLAKSGIACALECARRGARVTIVERGEPADAMSERTHSLAGFGVRIVTGSEDVSLVEDADLVLPSPAVSVHSPVLAAALSAGKECLSEIEFAARLYPHPWMIAVTGTNGKTTVTEMIAHLIRSGEVKATVGGNIGIPLVEVLAEVAPDEWVVVEVSSFQLALAPTFSPAAGIFLNFEEDHLDWHADTEEYFNAKANLIYNLRDGGEAILPWSDKRIKKLSEVTSPQVSFFSCQPLSALKLEALAAGESFVSFDGKTLVTQSSDSESKVEVDGYGLKGIHNHENAAAASAAALRAGIGMGSIAAGLSSFTTAGHRLSHVSDIDGVSYFDDSKATNPHAVKAAVWAFTEPVILLLGGRNKGSDLASLARFAAANTKSVICFGEAGPEIFEHLPSGSGYLCGALEDAVSKAASIAERGDVVLLSPACASFDAFGSYAERGEAFAAAVGSLMAGAERA